MAESQHFGMAYPFGETLNDYFSLRTGRDILRTSIINILMTTPGELPYRPNFGSDLASLLFDPNNDLLDAEIVSEVTENVRLHDPRIDIVDVQTSVPENMPNTKIIEVVYVDVTSPANTDSVKLSLDLTNNRIDIVG